LREKTEALEQWAVLLRSIIDPDSDRKVVPLRR
jgi:hypothetical protein